MSDEEKPNYGSTGDATTPNGTVARIDDVNLQNNPDQYSYTGDKHQLIDGSLHDDPEHTEKKEFSPLNIEEQESEAKKGEGLKVIIASSVIFAISVTIALIVTIYFGPPQVAMHGAVACEHSVCSKIGTDMLRKGGHAVDAAVAAAFCLGVVKPESSGIGGGGFMVIHDHRHVRSEVIDFRPVAPSDVRSDMFTNYTKAFKGGLSVAVPGAVRGLEKAHAKYGLLRWNELIQPSIDLARKGFNVSRHLAETLRYHVNLKPNTTLGSIFMPRGQLVSEGDWIKREDLAEVLEAIASDGADALYTGKYAKEIADTVQAQGGVLKEEDLYNYKVLTEDPIQVDFNTFSVMAPPAPSGGPILLAGLNILNYYNFSTSDSGTPLTYHRIIEAFKFAYAKRHDLGDPQFGQNVSSLVDYLLSEEYGNFTNGLIDDNRTFSDVNHYLAGIPGPTDHGTSQISAIGESEDMVSMTTSINTWFGSEVVTPSGILLNNDINDFSFPSREKARNSTPHKANYIEGGKRPLSSMTPTIVHSQERPCGLRIAVGAVNGTQIPAGIAQVIVNLVAFHKSVKEAVDEPRVINLLSSSETSVEKDMPERVKDGLRERGHILTEVENIASVNVVMKVNETLHGYSDPRTYGNASVF